MEVTERNPTSGRFLRNSRKGFTTKTMERNFRSRWRTRTSIVVEHAITHLQNQTFDVHVAALA